MIDTCVMFKFNQDFQLQQQYHHIVHNRLPAVMSSVGSGGSSS